MNNRPPQRRGLGRGLGSLIPTAPMVEAEPDTGAVATSTPQQYADDRPGTPADWIGRIPEVSLRFYAGGRAEEEPRAIVWGGVEEAVEVERRSLEESDGIRRMRYRLRMQDGTTVEVSRIEPGGTWTLERELG